MVKTPFQLGPLTIEAVHGVRDREICLGYELPGAGCPIVVASVSDDEDDEGYPITREVGRRYTHLFAASPGLLAACEAAVMATGGSQFWNGETYLFLVMAEAAVANANGAEFNHAHLDPAFGHGYRARQDNAHRVLANAESDQEREHWLAGWDAADRHITRGAA